MKGYKKNSFWILGALVTMILLVVIGYMSYENQAMDNVENCERVKFEMTIEKVIEIMGEPDDLKTYIGRINYTDMEVTKYYYNAPSGSSVGVNIFFNAQTEKVVRTECKD